MSDTSTFDPDAFMNQEVEGPMDTKYPTVPEGVYTSIIEDVKVRQFTNKNGDTGIVADILHSIQDDEVKKKMDKDKVLVKQGLFIDVAPNGGLDLSEGKNIKLGKLRDAVGQNAGGPWNLNHLKGAGPLTIAVSTRSDPNDPETVYNDVKRTAPYQA